ncbi:MAG: hypothetical protein KAS23_01125 [Anaerohalosphaera sp.]|nr:hypothetical protein [Anaerohalosphaera sp.]
MASCYSEFRRLSSFLPGIGGLDGVPLWCMYVNRGQGVVSFGVGNKGNSIAEFLPANWAYQLVGMQAFRHSARLTAYTMKPSRMTRQVWITTTEGPWL